MAKEKPTLNVAFVGHVDHGKSTSIGRLMFDSGRLPQQEYEKLKALALEKGKAGFEFAYVMDKFKEERERGVTIDLSYQKLLTDKFEVTIIDAPGHRDFIKNMITGASQADAAFLCVAAKEGVQPQTKEHAWLLKTMGVGQVSVLVNKMDTVDFKEDIYKKVKEEVSVILNQVGFKTDDMAFIPASGFKGDNIVKKSEKMDWYKGPTVMEQLDKFNLPGKPTNLPMRMPLQDVYDITGIGTVPVGKIETGVMKIGQKVIVLPGRSGTGIKGEVRTIEMHHEQLKEAEAGDNCGINIRGVGKKDVARGDVVCDASKPATIAEEFVAQVAVISHPTVIAKGYTPVFHVHTAQVPCQFTELIEVNRGGETIKNPDFLKNGDVAKVRIKPIGNLVLETQADNPHMSRFAIRDAGSTVAAGVCIELTPKKI
ncbi:translation elongation factor EF-1 subunit alpha [Candidatus Parvarchaeota archaeon]|nr:MAG: translation elongation factor EF-1 subunit alpha [Candidatus Parvarchaeota archaeon]HIG52063.1 translation elongation factor EF-1 subunit alpha [Candidatus Pacearchaeota archaeon]